MEEKDFSGTQLSLGLAALVDRWFEVILPTIRSQIPEDGFTWGYLHLPFPAPYLPYITLRSVCESQQLFRTALPACTSLACPAWRPKKEFRDSHRDISVHGQGSLHTEARVLAQWDNKQPLYYPGRKEATTYGG